MTHIADPDRWWDKYSRLLNNKPAYTSLIATEQSADELQCFNFWSIHGLLQTENYSRAITRGCRLLPMTKNELEGFNELRMQRQWHVLEQTKPPRIQAVIDESALHRRVGGAQVLCEQLRHLGELNTLPHISIRILPLHRPFDFFGDFGLNEFTLISQSYGTRQEGLYCEQAGSYESFTENILDIRRYRMLFQYLWQEALNAKRSAALLKDLADKLAKE